MSERETQGGCFTHGPYEICGHTTKTCPDFGSGEAQEVSTNKDAEGDRKLVPETDTRIENMRAEQMFKMQEHAFGKIGAVKELKKSIEGSPWTAALKKFDEVVAETKSAGKTPKYEVNKTVEVDVDGQTAIGVIVKAEGSVYLMETEVGGKQMITLATEDELREPKY